VEDQQHQPFSVSNRNGWIFTLEGKAEGTLSLIFLEETEAQIYKTRRTGGGS